VPENLYDSVKSWLGRPESGPPFFFGFFAKIWLSPKKTDILKKMEVAKGLSSSKYDTR
jgi:hypothetical protein